MLASIVFFCSAIVIGSCGVLDPALFLSPSPPLTSSAGSISPGKRWTSTDQSDLSIAKRDAENRVSDTIQNDEATEKQETMENAETFWPRMRVSSYGLSPVHIPVTFSISGTYGGGSSHGTGVIGSSYGTVSADDDDRGRIIRFGNYGKSALAGSSYGYGYPGVRVFGSTSKLGWSGWGNGKWGHYGKG